MATKVTVELSDRAYQRAQTFARMYQREMEELLSEMLESDLNVRSSDWSEPDPAVDREMEAYIAMHPHLKEKYFGKHVAVYHGELIDYDDDETALFERIDEKYPDEFVWLAQVGTEPIETIVVRSPRLIRE